MKCPSAADVLARLPFASPLLERLSVGPGPTAWTIADLSSSPWLAERRDAAKRRWKVDSDRTAGRLWWYSASYLLVGSALLTSLDSSHAVVGSPPGQVWLREFGYLDRFQPQRVVAPPELPLALTELLTPVIEALAPVADTTGRALWAVAGDVPTMAVREAITAGRSPESAWPQLVAFHRRWRELAPLPRLRTVDVSPAGVRTVAEDTPTRPPARRSALRNSCCLLLEVPGSRCCTTCPRQTPAVREARWVSSLEA